jgi:hypothetical protein
MEHFSPITAGIRLAVMVDCKKRLAFEGYYRHL